MALFTLSDTHLSLAADKPMEVFGSRWFDYHRRIEDNWRAAVHDDDTVVIGGDVSWGMTLDEALDDFRFLDSLPGKKLLGKGNHDYWWDTVKKMKEFCGVNGIHTIDFLYNNSFPVGNLTVCGSRGWFNDQKYAPGDSDYAKIVAREAQRIEMSVKTGLKYGGEIVLFLHFPPVFKNYLCTEILAVLHKYNIRRCFFGHIHNVYDMPPSFLYEDIEFIVTSADYLEFIPLIVKSEHSLT